MLGSISSERVLGLNRQLNNVAGPPQAQPSLLRRILGVLFWYRTLSATMIVFVVPSLLASARSVFETMSKDGI